MSFRKGLADRLPEIALCIVLLSIFLNIRVPIFGVTIPSVEIILFAVVLLSVNTLKYREVKFFGLGRYFLIFLLVMLVASLNPVYYTLDVNYSLIQLLVAISVFFILVWYFTLDYASYRRALFFVITVILIGVVLETNITSVREFFLAIRVALYPEDFLYANSERDFILVNSIRPSFIYSEPSYLVQAIATMSVAISILDHRFRAFLFVVLVNCFVFLTSNSPIALAAFLLIFSVRIIKSVSSIRLESNTNFFLLNMAVLSAFLIFVINFPYLYSVLSSRGEAMGNLDVTSENVRFVFSFLTAESVLNESPILGVGFGNKVVASEISVLNFYEPDIAMGNNTLGRLLSYSGVLGLSSFMLLLIGIARKFIYEARILFLFYGWVAIHVFSQGGIESIYWWAFFSVIVSSLYAVNKSKRHVVNNYRSFSGKK